MISDILKTIDNDIVILTNKISQIDKYLETETDAYERMELNADKHRYLGAVKKLTLESKRITNIKDEEKLYTAFDLILNRIAELKDIDEEFQTGLTFKTSNLYTQKGNEKEIDKNTENLSHLGDRINFFSELTKILLNTKQGIFKNK